MTIFTSARLKLTFWYTLIIFFITLVLSSTYYLRTTQVLNLQFHGIENRLQDEERLVPAPPGNRRFQNSKLELLEEEYEDTRDQILKQVMVINGLIVVLAAAASYFLAGKTLRPIQRALTEQKRFVADAAHELKTPLTALKASLEVELMDKKLTTATKKILKGNLKDVDNLHHLTENLLTLARVNEPNGLVTQPVALQPLIRGVVKQLKPLATSNKLTIKTKFTKQQLTVTGDEASLEKLLLILLDNAIKYGKAKTAVEINLSQLKQKAVIKVVNRGGRD